MSMDNSMMVFFLSMLATYSIVGFVVEQGNVLASQGISAPFFERSRR